MLQFLETFDVMILDSLQFRSVNLRSSVTSQQFQGMLLGSPDSLV